MTVAILKTVDDHDSIYQAIMLWCPGCERIGSGDTKYGGLHMIPVLGNTRTLPRWDWNGDLVKVTLYPSMLTRGSGDFICHSFLRDGVWDFLTDSTHQYAGQKVDMRPLPEWILAN